MSEILRGNQDQFHEQCFDNLTSIYMMEGRRRELTFGVFAGGIGGSQVTAFTVEFGKAQISFAAKISLRLNLISNKQVHESGMSEQELFHRLNEADVYVILGHIHQGNPQWSAVVIQELLTELKATRKVGWPERKHLTCPVFTQDKYQYIHKCHMVYGHHSNLAARLW